MEKVIMVIGAGSIGSRHLRNLRTCGVERLVACDPREERLEVLKKEIPGLKTYRDYREALDKEPVIDAGFICSPTSMHLEQALALARRGIAMFIEKPVSHNEEGLEELVEAVYSKKVPVMMGMCYRFHAGVKHIRELVHQGAIGKVYSVSFFSGQYLPDWHPWADYRKEYSANRSLGGGVILDSIHSLDSLRWIFGEPEEVIGCYGKVSDLEIDTEDVASAIIRYPDGMIAEVHEDYLQRVKTSRCVYIGEKGSIEWKGVENKVCLFRAETGKWEEVGYDFQVNDMYIAEVDYFLSCLESNSGIQPDLFDGVRTLALALAIKRSWENRRVQSLAETPLSLLLEKIVS